VSFDGSLLRQYAPDLLSGLRLTIEIWIVGALIALMVGTLAGGLLTFGRPGVSAVVRCYVEFFRGTPLLVQLFLLYYGGPHIGLTLSAMSAGLIGLGLYGGAYFAEICRAGLASIPAGQLEAARAFGYARRDAIIHIMLPQALILMLPPAVNLLVIILKDTAVLSILTIPELTFQVTGMTLETFAFVEPYAALALGYWLLVEIAARLGHSAERRLSRHMVSVACR
jgi:polar amino acid transport system permease protein